MDRKLQELISNSINKTIAENAKVSNAIINNTTVNIEENNSSTVNNTIVGYSKDIEHKMLVEYLLGNKEINKIKRLDPSQKIIDATDIDWNGFTFNFRGHEYTFSNTFEVFNLLFSTLQYIINLHGSEDLVWNDAGKVRTLDNDLYWNLDEEDFKNASDYEKAWFKVVGESIGWN